MKNVNRTTEEGRQAFQELSSQIQENTRQMAQNSVEWWKWQEVVTSGISKAQMIWDIREAELESLRTQLRWYAREGATKEDLNRAEEIRAKILMELTSKYVDIQEKIQDLTRAQEELNRQMLAGEIATGKYNEEMRNMGVLSKQLEGELFEIKLEMNDLIAEVNKGADAFESVIRPLDHFARMGMLTVEEQIRALRRLKRSREIDMEEQWEIDERLFEHYKDLLNEQKERIEEAYKERLKLLEETTDAQIKEIQRLIDALDVEATQEDREEAERQHNQKIAELLKERYYHELRTGIEHQREIERINQEIAEENIRWQLQQNEWAREDRRKEYEKQIEDIQEQAEKQRQEWEKAWERLEADFSEHNINMIAAAAAYDDDWYEDAVRKAQRWFEGFKEALPESLVGGYLSSLVRDAEEYLDEIEDRERDRYDRESSGSEGSGSKGSGTDEQYYRDKALLGFKKLAEDAYASGNKSLGDYYHERANELRKQGPTLDPNNTKSAKELEKEMLNKYGKAHEGAYVLESGAAVLLKGERVLSPQLTASFDRLANAILSNPRIENINQGRSFKIDRVMNVEQMIIQDDLDAEIVARETARTILRLGRIGGSLVAR
jgi:hypothetical protein